QQVEKIKSIYNEAKQDPEMQSLYQDMKAAKEEMGNLIASDNATNEELIEQHNKIQGIRQQLSRKRLDKNLAVREVLTSEQRKKMVELKRQRRQRWKSRRGNR
uniref:Spy/CpxP family protein refolding chaperone n=1 Tax=Calothrix rhizosoleniae TaxID=888997 RepID=UPI00190F06CF